MSEGLAEIKEDTAERVRRNLVVFATGILAMILLDAALEGKFFGVAEVKNVKPWKGWLCVIAVLLYLRTRYMLSRSVAQYSEDFTKKRYASAQERLNHAVVDALLSTLDNRPTRSIRFEMPKPKSPDDRLQLEDEATVFWHWTRGGSISAAWTRLPSKTGAAANGPKSKNVSFEVGRILYFKHQVSAWLEAHDVTWDVLEYRLPILLSNAALYCGFYKFVLAAFGWPSLVDRIWNGLTAAVQWISITMFDFLFTKVAPLLRAAWEWASAIGQ